MASIGPSWAEDSWVQTSWVVGAWDGGPVVVEPAPKPSGAGLAFPLPRLVPPRIGRIFSIVGRVVIKFEGTAAVSLVRGEVKTLQAAENLEYDDDEEVLATLDDWFD